MSVLNKPAEITKKEGLSQLKLPAINPDTVKANTVKTIDKVVDYVSKNPNVVAAGMAVTAIGNAIKYASETAPQRAEADRIARLETEQARLRSELEAQKINDLLFPPKKETI